MKKFFTLLLVAAATVGTMSATFVSAGTGRAYTFAQLAAESHVDVEANRKTCHKIYNTAQSANNAASRLSRWTMLCIVLWITVIVGATLTIVNYGDWTPECVVATGTATAAVLLMLILRVHPKLSALRKLHLDETSHVSSLKSEALEQMEPLNRLYDWDLFTRMMAKTVPNLEFDPYFTTRRLAEMEHVYGWDSSFNDERSVMSCRSGALNGNPLVICRTRKMIMGSKTYTGYKEIFWETYEQDGNGNHVVVSHTETLSAEYTAPYPEYYELTFTRYSKMFGYMPYFGFQLGFAYGHEGYKMEMNEETGYISTISGATECVYDIAEIHTLAHFHYDIGHVKVMLNIGPYAGKRLRIERIGGFVDEDIVHSFLDTDRRFDFGAKAGAGLALAFDPVEFHINAKVRYSWSNLYNPDYLSPYYYSFAYPLDVMVTAGLHFHISRKTGKTNAMLRKEARTIVFGEEKK